jgi:DNA-binding PadR family transcriptional regulator
MSSEIRLTPTSYIVLGLVQAAGEATPYDLKQAVAAGLGDLWSLQHAQLYTEPERLAKAEYLNERREEGGRRRRHYSVTEKGRAALQSWLGEPTAQFTELRDLALLKVFFGADVRQIAESQLSAHEAKLAEYEEIRRTAGEAMARGQGISLEAGLAHEQVWVEFWSKLAG